MKRRPLSYSCRETAAVGELDGAQHAAAPDVRVTPARVGRSTVAACTPARARNCGATGRVFHG